MTAVEVWDFSDSKALHELNKLLQVYKADLTRAYSTHKYTLLHACAKSPYCPQILHFLLQNYPRTFGGANLKKTDKNGNTILHYLCHYGNVDSLVTLSLLSTIPSDVFAALTCQTNNDGVPPIMTALEYHNDDIATYLKSIGASTAAVDNNGR